MISHFSTWSTEEKVGQLFFPAAFINDSEEEIQKLESLIRNHHIGGLTFFHSRASAATNFEKKVTVVSNEKSLERLQTLIQRYQRASRIPLLISIDAEWGLAMRVENTPQYPYALTLGSLKENADHLIEQVAYHTGLDLKASGIDYNLAPVADINDNPENPVIGYRSFGEDREKVFQKALQYCKGLNRAGVLNCLKHFPGHGNTAVDSHLGLPVIEKDREALYQQELYPFKKLIAEGVDSVMVGHLAVPALTGGKKIPATLSSEIINGILRTEFGFDGVVISDALNMHSVSKMYPEKGVLELQAFEAGNDMLCFSEHIAEAVQKIRENSSKARIDESAERIYKLKVKAGISTDQGPKEASANNNLNKQLAKKTIIQRKNAPASDIPQKETLVCIGTKTPDTFLDRYLQHKPHSQFIDPKDTAPDSIINGSQLLLITPPSIKPGADFGFNSKDIALIKKYMQHPELRVVLFGNPYFLHKFPELTKARELIVSGQIFTEFQEQAALIALGMEEGLNEFPFTP